MVITKQEEVTTEKSLCQLKRSRSPSAELFPYKTQALQEGLIKRKFLSKQGPGSVKSIWVIRDWDEHLALESQVLFI